MAVAIWLKLNSEKFIFRQFRSRGANALEEANLQRIRAGGGDAISRVTGPPAHPAGPTPRPRRTLRNCNFIYFFFSSRVNWNTRRQSQKALRTCRKLSSGCWGEKTSGRPSSIPSSTCKSVSFPLSSTHLICVYSSIHPTLFFFFVSQRSRCWRVSGKPKITPGGCKSLSGSGRSN